MALFGELGTGKTSLTKGIAAGMNVDPTAVSSPTFALIHEYPGRLRLIHTDLYRLIPAQLDDIGLSDYLDDHTIIAIEWADRWGKDLPSDRLEVHLSHRTTTTRRAIFRANGPIACRLLTALRSRLPKSRPTREPGKTRVQLPRPRRTPH